MGGWITFEKIFKGKVVYEIPIYQRAYTWEEKQLKDFISDLKNQPEGEEYFFGTFLFQKKERKLFNKYDIIDGQQRITTAVIFINSALKVLEQKNIDDEHKKLIEILRETYIRIYDQYKLVPSNNDFL